MRRGKYKAVIRDLPAQKLLYDVIADPGETRSLTDAQATVFDELAAELARFKETMRLTAARIGAAGPATLTPEEEARLRSLGYIR